MRRGGVRHRCFLAKAKEYVHPTPSAEKMAFLNPETQKFVERILGQLQTLADTAESAPSSLKQRGDGSENDMELPQDQGEMRTHQRKLYERQQKMIRHNEDFITKFKGNKKWSTQAQLSNLEFRFQIPAPPLDKNAQCKIGALSDGQKSRVAISMLTWYSLTSSSCTRSGGAAVGGGVVRGGGAHVSGAGAVDARHRGVRGARVCTTA